MPSLAFFQRGQMSTFIHPLRGKMSTSLRGANVQLPLLIDQFDLSYIVSQYLITRYLTAVRQDVNSLENEAAVQELEFAINLALSILSEAKVTNIYRRKLVLALLDTYRKLQS